MTTATMEADVLDILSEQIAEQREQAIAEFWETVTALADGEHLDPADVADMLRRADKDVNDLRTAVRVMKARRGHLETIAAAAAAVDERPGITKALAAADAALNEAERLHELAVGPLYQRRREIDSLQTDAAAAKESLVSGCPYLNVSLRLQAIANSEQAIGRTLGPIHQERDRAQQVLDAGGIPEWQVSTLRAKVAQKDQEAAPHIRRLDELSAQREEINRLAMTP